MINTRNRRASLFARGQRRLGVLPLPDGAIDSADRRHIAWLYRGFAEIYTPACITLSDAAVTLFTLEDLPCPT